MFEKGNTKHFVVKIGENMKPEKMKIKDLSQLIEMHKSNWGNRGLFKYSVYKSIIEQNLSYAYKVGDDVLGVCLMEYIPSQKNVEVDLICIKKELQGNHLGKNLLSFCIDNCKKLKYKNFSLHVSTKNITAINLYSKLGFKIEKKIEKYYNDENPENNDAYYMTLNY